MPIGLLALTGVEANETPANGFEFAEGSVAGMDVDFVTADANDVVANGLFEVTFVGVKAGAGVAADGVLSVPILLFFHLLLCMIGQDAIILGEMNVFMNNAMEMLYEDMYCIVLLCTSAINLKLDSPFPVSSFPVPPFNQTKRNPQDSKLITNLPVHLDHATPGDDFVACLK